MLAELVSESEETACNWSKIASNYAVPKSLYRHQLDTITLILKGKHVFCGSPTGSGKTKFTLVVPKKIGKSYLAELFRQIKRSLAELFHQIKRSVAEQFHQIKRSVAEHYSNLNFNLARALEDKGSFIRHTYQIRYVALVLVVCTIQFSRLIQLVLLHFAWTFWVTLVTLLEIFIKRFSNVSDYPFLFSYQGMQHV